MEDSVCCIAFIHIRTWALTLPLPFSSLVGEAIKDSGLRSVPVAVRLDTAVVVHECLLK